MFLEQVASNAGAGMQVSLDQIATVRYINVVVGREKECGKVTLILPLHDVQAGRLLLLANFE